jgi:xanthine dehydrogenase accessory factor
MLVGVKGAGDLASGTIHRLHRAGFAVVATELPQPLALRRTVAFAEAIYSDTIEIEGLTGARAETLDEARTILAQGRVPVLVDPDGALLRALHPSALIDAMLAKHPTGIRLADAQVVLALGPGFEAGVDAHAVIETNRGHHLGRVYLNGCAEANTGVPGDIAGFTSERLLRAPADGPLLARHAIADVVQAGEVIATVGGAPMLAQIGGVLRGLVHDGLVVRQGMKVGDIDPRARREHCFSISDKSRAIAGGALEALLYLLENLPTSAQPSQHSRTMNQDSVVVRALTSEDYTGVRRVDELTQRQYRGAAWDSMSDVEKDACLVSRQSEFAINLRTGYGFVATKGNDIIGFIFAHKTLPFASNLYIRYIGVDPAYQGCGVGALLYRQLIEKARKDGIKEIATLINLDNPRSMKLHEKVGFTLIDRKEAVLKLP